MLTHHDTSLDTIGVNGLRREHQVGMLLEVRVDVAEKE